MWNRINCRRKQVSSDAAFLITSTQHFLTSYSLRSVLNLMDLVVLDVELVVVLGWSKICVQVDFLYYTIQ